MSQDNLATEARVTQSRAGAWCIVEVDGELDVLVSPRLEAELREAIDAGADQLAVDLDRVDFLDSTALRTLVATLHRAEAHNVRFAVVCGVGRLRKLLRITRLDEVFEVVASRHDLP